MKRSLLLSLLFLPFAGMAQDLPEVTFEDGSFNLLIPYFSYDGKAYAVELSTVGDAADLMFQVDVDSITPVEPENEIEITEEDGACTSSTKAAFLSCRAEVEEEELISLGKCFNSDDTLCESGLAGMKVEAEEECEEQYEARIQICLALGEDPYIPDMDPANFMSAAEIYANPNEYFPLVPGNEWVYEAEDETVTVTVTDETREILGISAVVVRDVVTDEEDELIEDTDDWFAQDLEGNIWYMGEISRNYEDGRLVDVEGSWEAGLDGASAGILIRAQPVVDEVLRQEFLLGDAEDMGMTVSVTADGEAAEEADVVCEANCLQTLEFTPIEPEAMEHKYYYPGIGKILIIDLESGDREELVSYSLD